MTKTPAAPMDTYWVTPGSFLAGAYPLWLSGSGPEDIINQLISTGINTFIDLTKEHEMQNSSYLPYLTKMPKKLQIRYFNHPIQDFGIPSIDRMQKIQNLIKQQLSEGRNIYLHCLGGIGRTGTVVGCYLVEQGMSGNQALTQIISLRSVLGRIRINSPETDEQINFVLNWQSHWFKNH
jgi:protein-tyrosine phosphatase